MKPTKMSANPYIAEAADTEMLTMFKVSLI